MAGQRERPQADPEVSWNINGITQKKLELEEILVRLNVDVMAVQETRLFPDNELMIQRYQVYRKDREQAAENRREDGVALLVKRKLDHHLVTTSELEALEAVEIAINTRDTGHLRIADCYVRPRTRVGHLGRDLEALIPRESQFVAIGDFNAKSPVWNCRSTNSLGRELWRYQDIRGELLVMGPEERTYVGPLGTRPDILNRALLNRINMTIQDLSTHDEGDSDHRLILLELGERRSPVREETDRLGEIQDAPRCDPDMTQIGPINDERELEERIRIFEEDVNAAVKAATTVTMVRRLVHPMGELPPLRCNSYGKEEQRSERWRALKPDRTVRCTTGSVDW